jgi:hypothetical protein
MSETIENDTWQRENGLVYWLFDLPLGTGEPPRDALRRHVVAALDALDGLGRAVAAEWTSVTRGEDAAVQPRGTSIDASVVDATLAAHPDIYRGRFDIDLTVLGPDGDTQQVIPEGASMTVEIDPPDAPGGAGQRVELSFDLNVDLFAKQSWGRIRDNHRLADLNAPRLTQFLRRLRDATGANLRHVEAGDYAGQVTETGFV